MLHAVYPACLFPTQGDSKGAHSKPSSWELTRNMVAGGPGIWWPGMYPEAYLAAGKDHWMMGVGTELS